MKCKKSISLFLLIVISFVSSMSIYAEEDNFGFRVEPIFPDNQIGKSGYYHIKTNPSETITLKSSIINDSPETIVVLVQSLNAYSGKDGIVYQKEITLEGSSIIDEQFNFKNYTSHLNEVTLKPFETKEFEFTINVPSIQGTILGSMEFKVFKGTDQLANEEENSQLLIDQFNAVNIGVQLNSTETKQHDSVILDNPFFSSDLASILVPIENPYPTVVSNISGSFYVSKLNDLEKLIEGDIPTFKMSPMSRFHYPYLWLNTTLESGIYEVHSTININGKIEHFKPELTIDDQEIAETISKKEDRGELIVSTNHFPWEIIIISFLVLIVCSLLLLLIKSKSTKNKFDLD